MKAPMVKLSKCLDIMSVALPLTTQTIDMKWKNLVKGQKKEKNRDASAYSVTGGCMYIM